MDDALLAWRCPRCKIVGSYAEPYAPRTRDSVFTLGPDGEPICCQPGCRSHLVLIEKTIQDSQLNAEYRALRQKCETLRQVVEHKGANWTNARIQLRYSKRRLEYLEGQARWRPAQSRLEKTNVA